GAWALPCSAACWPPATASTWRPTWAGFPTSPPGRPASPWAGPWPSAAASRRPSGAPWPARPAARSPTACPSCSWPRPASPCSPPCSSWWPCPDADSASPSWPAWTSPPWPCGPKRRSDRLSAEEAQEQAGQLQGPVALHAVARAVHHLDHGVGPPPQQLGHVLLAHYRGQAPPDEEEGGGDPLQLVPEPPGRGERVRPTLGAVGVPPPAPAAVGQLLGVVKDAPTQRRLGAARVEADGALEDLVEGGEDLGSGDEGDDGLGLLAVHTGRHVHQRQAPHQLGPLGGQGHGGQASQRHAH